MPNKNEANRFTKSEFDNIATVKRLFYEVWNDRHLVAATEIFSPDVVLQYDQGVIKGLKEWKEEFYSPIMEALSGVRVNIEDIIANRDQVITRWKARGVHKGPYLGVNPTGEMIEFRGISWMKLCDGKIVEMWTNWDLSHLFHQLLSEVKELRGIIPICMHCKKIRDDKGYWNQLEKYITEHSDIQFSHSVCDKCIKERYPGRN